MRAMQKCYLDSNFLVYIKNENSPYFQRASSLICELISKEVVLYISPLALDEFLHSFLMELRQKNYIDIYSGLQKALDSILKLPKLCLINPPVEIEAQKRIVGLMKKYQLRARDAYHLLTMVYNKIDSFATFDSDFKKVFEDKLIIRADSRLR